MPFWTSASLQPPTPPLQLHPMSSQWPRQPLVTQCRLHSCHPPCQLTRPPWPPTITPSQPIMARPLFIRTKPSLLQMEGAGKSPIQMPPLLHLLPQLHLQHPVNPLFLLPLNPLLRSLNPGTPAQNVERIMPPAQICRDTSRHIVVLIPTMPRNAMSVVRCMSPCLLCPCTSWLTTWATNVTYVEKPFHDHGFCKAIWGRTAAINPMVVPTAANVLLIVLIFGHTCKLIRLSRTSSASDATSPSHSSPTWTSIMSRPVSKISPFPALILLPVPPVLPKWVTAWPLQEDPQVVPWLNIITTRPLHHHPEWDLSSQFYLRHSRCAVRHVSWIHSLWKSSPKRPLVITSVHIWQKPKMKWQRITLSIILESSPPVQRA